MQEICASKFSVRRIMMLEFSQYLENFLWPNYNAENATRAHTMSIVVMVNEKFRERVQVWEAFEKNPMQFAGFFQKVLEACLEESIMDFNLKEQTALIVFLNHCFNSMEVSLVREEAKRLVSLSMWISLQQGRRELEFRKYPKWRKYWKIIRKKDNPEHREKLEWERKFLHKLMIKFMTILETIPAEGIYMYICIYRPIKRHMRIFLKEKNIFPNSLIKPEILVNLTSDEITLKTIYL